MTKACVGAGFVTIPAKAEWILISRGLYNYFRPEHFFPAYKKGFPVNRKALFRDGYGFRMTLVHSSPCSKKVL
ncbi:hypothetical protein SAMN04488127_2650 [Bhargavaea ginsengi]|uniref:Uncharacterized protein n=1 Tax=Bhargavaea ginsengi TaxID=426757 RepID=A0A1H7BLG4_9BACL|nr:hypothetical protein SAMN04488127_2650 [Bhargavaea ginsengi]